MALYLVIYPLKRSFWGTVPLPSMSLNLEVRCATDWVPLGEVRLLESEALGLNSRTEFCYDLDYAT